MAASIEVDSFEASQALLQVVYKTIEDFNVQLPPAQRLAKAPSTVLVGDQGHLDSLGLINLTVSLEDSVSDFFGKRVKLLDESLLSDPKGPFQTVGSLADHIARLAAAQRP